MMIRNKSTMFASIFYHKGEISGIVYFLSALRRSGRLLVCGDFNAHRPNWGSEKTTPYENVLAAAVESTG